MTHNKKDSTGICFIGKQKKFKKFLSRYIPDNPGYIKDIKDNIIGKHIGLHSYTIGQRCSFDITNQLKRSSSTLPWFVAKKNIEDNTIIAVQGTNNINLFTSTVTVHKIHWIIGNAPASYKYCCTAKIRSYQPEQKCEITINKITNTVLVNFKKLQRAVTPGQSIVFYKNDICLGGGIIYINY